MLADDRKNCSPAAFFPSLHVYCCLLLRFSVSVVISKTQPAQRRCRPKTVGQMPFCVYIPVGVERWAGLGLGGRLLRGWIGGVVSAKRYREQTIGWYHWTLEGQSRGAVLFHLMARHAHIEFKQTIHCLFFFRDTKNIAARVYCDAFAVQTSRMVASCW